MTEELYLNRIQEMRRKLDNLRKQFIEEYPIKNGDIVNVVNKRTGEPTGETGVCVGIDFGSYPSCLGTSIQPIVKKIKKDGTPSQHNLYIPYLNKIVKAE